MQEKAVESIKSQYVHQRRLLPALALDLLETTPCLLSLEDCPSMAHEKIHLALFTLFMIATASTHETYPSPLEPPLHTQSLIPGSNMNRVSPAVFGNLSNTLSLKELCLTQV